MTEHDEQAAVCSWLDITYPDVLYWANPNGAWLAGNASKRAAQMNKLKAEGLLPGVSDLTVFEPRPPYSCLFLEMKTRSGRPTDNQLWFLRQVEARGAFGAVAYGFEEAKEIIEKYLEGKMK